MAIVLQRSVHPGDIPQLIELIRESTNNATMLTSERLHNCLFGMKIDLGKLGKIEDTSLNAVNLSNTDTSICKAHVAELDDKLIGYVIYHYFYSPWLGHNIWIDDIFVTVDHRMKGIARCMVNQIAKSSTSQNVNKFLFTLDGRNRDLIGIKDNIQLVRDDNTDWGVHRIFFGNVN